MISIDGGPVVEEGTEATIKCNYTGSISYKEPHFRINGANYTSDSLRDTLPFYDHHYHLVNVGEAYYTLTLAKAQTSNNGTTFQCFFGSGSTVSNTVTLIVTGKCVTVIVTGKGDNP